MIRHYWDYPARFFVAPRDASRVEVKEVGVAVSGKIKGSAVVHAVRALRHFRAKSEATLPRRLHKYLDTQILVSQWYPDDDFLELLEGLTRVLPTMPGDVWAWIGAQAAESNFAGVYAALVRPGDPAATLRRYPRIWRMHHDAGEAIVRQEEAGRGELEISHHMVEHEGFCRVESGHVIKLLQLAGAESVKASYRAVATPRSPAIWDVAWS